MLMLMCIFEHVAGLTVWNLNQWTSLQERFVKTTLGFFDWINSEVDNDHSPVASNSHS